MSTEIHNRALLVNLSISTWTARKFDRKVTTEVNRQYGAPADAGRYNKHLLAGSATQSYSHIMGLAQNIRVQHYARTLPWTDEGWRVLAADDYMAYMDWYRKAKSKFDKALEDFTADYPIVRGHQVTSNPMFKQEDYPDPKDIEAKFAMRVDISPIPMSSDIRVNLASDAIAEIEKSITDRATAGITLAMKDAWSRLYKATEHIAVKCADVDARLFKSMIENTRDLCQVLINLNITNDPDLEQMRQQIEAQLVSRDVEDLRENPAVRASVAEKANEILERMKAIGYAV